MRRSIPVKKRFLIFFLLAIVAANAAAQRDHLSGLYFSSHEVIKDKRTSLNLTAERPFDFTRGFALEFDANFRRGDGYYGYVFRITDNEKNNVDLVSNLGSGAAKFSLIWKDSALVTCQLEDIPNGDFDQWIKVRLQIDPEQGISITFNESKKSDNFASHLNLSKVNVVFGASSSPSFLSSDVSPMTLKDIKLYDHKQKLFRYWKLSEHGVDNVYDELERSPAEVKNPTWLIDKHTEWRKKGEVQFENLHGVTGNAGQIYFIDEKALYIYNSGSSAFDTVEYSSGSPFYCEGNQVIYNPFTNELWSYNFDKSEISKFDFSRRNWSLTAANDCIEPDFWHHSKFFSPVDSSLIAFGGYGHYTYKSVFNRYNIKKEGWEQFDLSNFIYPRYLSGSGFVDENKVLIFGGYGSKSGKQELSPQFYYDLYSVDLEDFSISKLWDSGENGVSFVPCSDLIYDPQTQSFLTLVYNSSHYTTHLQLARFRTDRPDMEILADQAPYEFLDTKSWCNLFLDRESQQLLAATVHESKMNLYSLAYPPLSASEVTQEEKISGGELKAWIIVLFILAMSVIAFIGVRMLKRKRSDVHSDVIHAESEIVHKPQIPRRKHSAIYFFGGFQVFDKNGAEITSSFTPTLKELFLIIFLYSVKNGKGVSVQVLNETIWFDKSGDSARNNRNVNISKLRPILDEIGSLELVKGGSYFRLITGEDLYSDYLDALNLLEKISMPTGIHEDEIQRLLSIASSGELLPTVQHEWVDSFKSDFSNLLIDSLISLAKNTEGGKDHLLFHIADCILKHDMLNDEAISIKCSALHNLGKKGLSKHSYDSFCRGYKNMMGTEFHVSYNDLLKHGQELKS